MLTHGRDRVWRLCSLQGMSRSAAVVLAYLMHAHRLPLRDAYFHTKSRRAIVFPNAGFR